MYVPCDLMIGSGYRLAYKGEGKDDRALANVIWRVIHGIVLTRDVDGGRTL